MAMGGGGDGDGDGVSPHPRLVGGRPGLGSLPSNGMGQALSRFACRSSQNPTFAPDTLPSGESTGPRPLLLHHKVVHHPPKPIPPAPNSSSNPNFSLPVLFSCWPAPFAYLRCIPPPPAVLSRTCLRRHCQYLVRGSLFDTRHGHEGSKKQLQPNPHVPAAAFALKPPKPVTQRAASANDGTQLP